MKSIRFCDLLPQPFDSRIFKLHDVPTPGADQMIVIAFRKHIIVLRFFPEPPCLRKALFAQDPHRSIDRVQGRTMAAAIEHAIQLSDCHVLPLQKRLDDSFPLETPIQPRATQTPPDVVNSLYRLPIVSIGAQLRHTVHPAESPL
jgi:hypothetical protein